MKRKSTLMKVVSLTIVFVLLMSAIPAYATDIYGDLFRVSFYRFYWLDENQKQTGDTLYSISSKDDDKFGISITKPTADTIKLNITVGNNEAYNKTKPVLMWVHKGDAIFDVTKWTDEEQWFRNKLEETFLLTTIPDYTQDTEIIIDVPLKLNLGLTGLLDGGYYEIEFFGEGTIPQQLMFAYESQTYTIQELEEYINFEMNDSIKEYYSADSGFRPEIDGFSFKNSDYEGGIGNCAGIAGVTTAKYNGYKLQTSYKVDGREHNVNEEYTWYNNVYGNESIHQIVLKNNNFIFQNSPIADKDGNYKAYPLVMMTKE